MRGRGGQVRERNTRTIGGGGVGGRVCATEAGWGKGGKLGTVVEGH